LGKHKNKGWSIWVATVGFVILLSAALYYQKWIVRSSYKVYRLYKSKTRQPYTGAIRTIPYPDGYSIHGLDVSHYQEYVDWDHLQAATSYGDTIQFHFVYIKATEGLWTEDRAYDSYWREAHTHGLICGAYHYFVPGLDPVRQAQNYIGSVSLTRGDMPPVIDIEETRGHSKAEIVHDVKIMADILEAKYGVKPILYSNINFIEDNLVDDFNGYYFWVAHYYQNQLTVEEDIDWLFWQHSDKAMLFGSNQSIDVNVFNGNMTALRDILLYPNAHIDTPHSHKPAS
jgi:lysozyme